LKVPVQITLLAILLFCAIDTGAQVSVGDDAPAIVLKNTKGATVKLSEFKGKVVMINFWATWCPPCRAEIPELVKWQEQYKDKGLQIVGITVPPTNARHVAAFISKNRVRYPILYGSLKTKALFTKSQVMPLTVVIDRSGKVAAFIEGIVYEDEFKESILPLLEKEI
jgi:peroxiredoxin